MLSHSTCPCCSSPLLRHTQSGQIYWFCSHCHQKMPDLATAIKAHRSVSSLLPVGATLERVG